MNYKNIFAFVRRQKAFSAFMTTLVVIGSFSAAFAARSAGAETVFLNVTDTLSTSEPSAYATHTFKFTASSSMVGSAVSDSNFTISFASGFSGVTSLTAADVTVTATGESFTVKSSCDALAGTILLNVAEDLATLELCQNTTIPGAKEITIRVGGTNRIQSPAIGSYQIVLAHDKTLQSQKVRVMILNNVKMTAVVDPILSFTVSSTTAGTALNGTTTNVATQDTLIDFGIIVPNEPKVAAQKLTISTNARNGFNVTARTDSEFKSYNGATIDGFNFMAGSSTPNLWSAPAADPVNDRTWGHVGITTSDITATDITNTNRWIGNFIMNPVTVFSQSSSTRNASTTVGYQVQVSDLQEAATDYQTNLIYVATPVF